MATIPYRAASWVGSPSIKEPVPSEQLADQTAAWMEGSILAYASTGTQHGYPSSAGTGTGAAVAGPTAATIALSGTIVQHASAGAAARSYYCVLTYVLTNYATGESIPSAEFIVNCAAGFVPGFNVPSAGAPAGATGFGAYVALAPGYEQRQNAAATNLGSEVDVANPLAIRPPAFSLAATNASAIAGLAATNSDYTFFDGAGGSAFAGSGGSRLGPIQSFGPIMPSTALKLKAWLLGNAYLEMSLLNTIAWNPGLEGSQAGLVQDSTTGYMPVLDTGQSNKLFTIQRLAAGATIGPTSAGGVGSLGARLIVAPIASTLQL